MPRWSLLEESYQSWLRVDAAYSPRATLKRTLSAARAFSRPRPLPPLPPPTAPVRRASSPALLPACHLARGLHAAGQREGERQRDPHGGGGPLVVGQARGARGTPDAADATTQAGRLSSCLAWPAAHSPRAPPRAPWCYWGRCVRSARLDAMLLGSSTPRARGLTPLCGAALPRSTRSCARPT
jgi:hypothetical protein